MSKVIIIGNGYIGQKAYKQLLPRVEEVILINGLTYNEPEILIEEFKQELGPKIKPTVGPSSPDEKTWVINCVGYTGKPNVDACEDEKEKCWQLNVTYPTLLANYCLQYNAKLINLSLIHI